MSTYQIITLIMYILQLMDLNLRISEREPGEIYTIQICNAPYSYAEHGKYQYTCMRGDRTKFAKIRRHRARRNE